jgi:hypothetical protein
MSDPTDDALARGFVSEYPTIRLQRRPPKLSGAWMMTFAHGDRHGDTVKVLELMRDFLMKHGQDASNDHAAQVLTLALKYMKVG